MAAVGSVLAANADSNLVPVLITLGVALLGGGGLAGIFTARATRQNYVQTGFRDLTTAATAEADQERRDRVAAERDRDRWRSYAYRCYGLLTRNGIEAEAPPDSGGTSA